MVDHGPRAGVPLRLSLVARIWERARLRELGLEDVAWDHHECCPFCTGAAQLRVTATYAPANPIPHEAEAANDNARIIA